MIILFGYLAKQFGFKLKKKESDEFDLVKKGELFEIRKYPAMLLATISLPAKLLTNARVGVNILYRYLTGHNHKRKIIADNAPLHIEDSDYATKVSLIMPVNIPHEEIPEPINPQIKISRMKSAYFAVIKFKGFVNNAILKEHISKLKSALMVSGIKCYGNIRFIARKAKWRFFANKNEVLIPIIWEDKPPLT